MTIIDENFTNGRPPPMRSADIGTPLRRFDQSRPDVINPKHRRHLPLTAWPIMAEPDLEGRAPYEPMPEWPAAGIPTSNASMSSPRLRTDVPHSARVYDYLIGGKDNFAADRKFATEIQKLVTSAPAMARANRRFVQVATEFLVAEAGVRQILNIGTGIPATPNVHEVAQRIVPPTRVVYVDNDPIVLSHARALMVSRPEGECVCLDGDLRKPETILQRSELTDTLDLDEPVAVILASVLMLVPDNGDPWQIVKTLMDAMPRDSYLVISHPTADFDPVVMDAAVAATKQAGTTFVPRARDEVSRLFSGCELVEPGLVPLLSWRPANSPADPHAAYYWAGVARKRG